ncbi:hypothetical protein, partial [Sinorhizobium meliloti]|uniref:hypothetical protein n=1 Tax=Rhizobium meliloti TaxID=382 RepID=UPI001A9D1143
SKTLKNRRLWTGTRLSLRLSLEESAEWTFIGYSLPTDDLWIRGILMRAFASPKQEGFAWDQDRTSRRKKDVEQRNGRLFKGVKIEYFRRGVKDFVQTQPLWRTDHRFQHICILIRICRSGSEMNHQPDRIRQLGRISGQILMNSSRFQRIH